MGYEVGPWADFAVAVAGAAAALTGLVFVAVSVNIQRIMQGAGLPGRVAQALIMLVAPLIVSIVVLVPEQDRRLLGGEFVVLGVILSGALGWLSRPGAKAPQVTWGAWAVGRFLPSVLIAVLIVVAGISLVAGSGGGLYWLVPAVLLAILAGLSNAWVLLIEILR